MSYLGFTASLGDGPLYAPATLVRRGSTYSGTTPGWDIEAYDYLAIHSTSSLTERQTIAGAGLYRFLGSWGNSGVGSPLARHLQLLNSAGAGIGYGGSSQCQSAGMNVSGIKSMAVGDYNAIINDPTISWDQNTITWLSAERIAPGLRYCRVNSNATPTIGTGLTAVPFNQTDVNIGGFTHSTSTNTDRILIDAGSGITLARASGSIYINTPSTGNSLFLLQKNGAQVHGCPVQTSSSYNGPKPLNFMSAPIEVVAGTDYFNTVANNSSASTTFPGTDGRCWFQVEEIRASDYANYQRVMASRTTAQAGLSTTFSPVSFNVEDYDTCAGFDLADPTKIYVPAGVRWARASFGVQANSVGNAIAAQVEHSTTAMSVTGQPVASIQSGGDAYVSSVSPWVQVTPGTSFRLMVRTGTGAGSVIAAAGTYLAVEFCNGFQYL